MNIEHNKETPYVSLNAENSQKAWTIKKLFELYAERLSGTAG